MPFLVIVLMHEHGIHIEFLGFVYATQVPTIAFRISIVLAQSHFSVRIENESGAYLTHFGGNYSQGPATETVGGSQDKTWGLKVS